ncbi:MAG: chromosome segregation protein SMC [Lachnospiraceae bacterium]|nr:chromosome segregation protein SMC [Lachnospiraceae bacterium]
MYLKSIEIQGFKSFANKLEFNFKGGITGIVGPNGSGKSNVADAVRWVLGEQSAKELRGSSMQDVIFSGTETRKPMGYASVAICLDNSDHALSIEFDEVTVARRVYRSGESEYLINGNTCRLRDVEELFYDTGIGQEGYSIIGQGQIDKILSGKAEERRELFDEAAGIVKFKRRKNIAQKKLSEEEGNLVRVNDIISELETQIKPLEEQSETAKIYLSKKEELKGLDINVFLLETDKFKTQIKETVEKQEIADGDLKEAVQQYEESRVNYEKKVAEAEEIDKKIEAKREEIAGKTLYKGQIQGQINVLKEQINTIKVSDEHFNNRIDALKKDKEGFEKEVEGIREKKREADEKVQGRIAILDEDREKLKELEEEISELEKKTEDGKSRIIETLNARSTIKSNIGRYDTMLEQAGIRQSEIEARFLQAKTDEETLNRELGEAKAKFDEAEEKLRGLEQSKVENDSKRNAITAKLSELDSRHHGLEIKYHEKKSRLESVKNMAERYDGYGNAVKKAMEQRSREKGICGVVADLFTVEQKYEVAIETALGGAMQNIVTTDEDTAKRIINYLKSEHAGRATFLPLTSIQPRSIPVPEALKEKGVVGAGNTLISVEKKYENVASNLLGGILVVDNIDNATLIARKYRYRLRIVTLGGEVLNPGGSISGGAYRANSAGLLGRQREIENLTKEGREIMTELDKVLSEVEELRNEQRELSDLMQKEEKDIREAGIERNTCALALKNLEERTKERREGESGIEREKGELKRQIEEIKAAKEKVASELEESEKTEEELKSEVERLSGENEIKSAEAHSLRDKIGEADRANASLLEAQKYAAAELERIESSISRCESELAVNLRNINENQIETENKLKEIEKLEKSIAQDEDETDDDHKELNALVSRKEELSKEQNEIFTSREGLAERKTSIEKEIYRLSSAKEKYEGSIENLTSYMWEEYEMTPSDAEKLRTEESGELASMKKKISSLKNDIRDLGAVNVNAIEDYKNLMERFNFMDEQRNDLVKAAEDLQKVIEELDENMKKQFSEKFGEIATQYDIVFKELFGGGKGTLELVNSEDLLSTDIKITAQPPGKKLQNMMQLSGGEKALSAIALLFAIQNLKPSPFCLLDEIEAALDEANVDRFASYLSKLTEHTQFIVITHRRGTMVKADRLYGITMQEKGVSTQVNVDLSDESYYSDKVES